MRRLIKRRGEERGAVSILVAILMVVLLGFAALAIDVGLMYAEKAQQQNGADAAALAIAEDCAVGGCPEDDTALAKAYADDNANDGLTNIQDVGYPEAGAVAVKTGAEETGGEENSISLFFANALGIPTAEIGAQATAQWGAPTAGPAPFPIIFSECSFEQTSGLQLIRWYKKSSEAPSCATGPPGGFANVDPDPGKCSAYVNIEEAISGSDPGNDGPPTNCTDVLDSWKNKIQDGENPIGLFPIYDSMTGSGNNAEYHLSGFAAFEIYGWQFKKGGSGQFSFQESYGDFDCSGQCIGIIGEFVEFVTLDDAFTLGPSEDYGADVVRLTLKDGS
ncbi:pilus assembly protein TadG-related protein [Arthrobacter pigmenti]